MEELAESAGWLFGWLLRNSAHAAILAAVIWALERTALRKLSPRWRYGLWMLVFVRLLIPIAPASAFSLFNLVELAPGAISHVTLQLLGLPAPMPVPLTEIAHPLADTPAWFIAALALWLPGAAVLGTLLYRDHRRLQHALQHTTPVTDSYILDLLQQSKAVMRVRSPVLLVEGEHVTSPAMSGWRRPRILLPVGLLERLTTDETRFLFLHELAHVKRGDIALNWILAGVQILHWFNPVVWLALRRLISVREEVCDERVLQSCFLGAARDYGLTLLHLLEECAPRRLMPALAGILDDVGTLRRRIRCIRTFGQPETHPWVPAGVTLALAISGLTENQNHHVLILSAATPTTAELASAARPVARARQPHARPRPHPVSQPALPTESDSFKAGNTLRSFSVAFRHLIEEAFGTGNERERAENASASLGIPVSTAAGKNPAHPAPTVTTPTMREIGTPTSRTLSRPYPLPPVGQRGDILRPPKTSASSAVSVPGMVRPQDYSPRAGRQPSPPSTSTRQSS